MKLLCPEDAAKKCGLSASQIRRLIREGLLKAEKIGRSYIINEKNLKSLKRRRSLAGTCKNTKEIKKDVIIRRNERSI